MALLLAASRWAANAVGEDTERAAETLSAAGWRVAVATASTPLATAWQQLHRPADRPLRVGGLTVGGLTDFRGAPGMTLNRRMTV